jgi:hypothetical protein
MSLNSDSPSEEPLLFLLSSDDDVIDLTHPGLPLPDNPYSGYDFECSENVWGISGPDNFFSDILKEYSSILPKGCHDENQVRRFLLDFYDQFQGILFDWNDQLILNGDQYDLFCLLDDYKKLHPP